MCGYGHLFFNNTVVVIPLLCFIAFAWFLVGIKDYGFACCRSRMPKMLRPNHEVFLANFSIRFLYEAFLELLICVLISLPLPKIEVNTGTAGLQWGCSLVVLFSLIALLSFVILKLFRGGPYVNNYYQPLTLSSIMCWSTRARSPDFNSTCYKSEF